MIHVYMHKPQPTYFKNLDWLMRQTQSTSEPTDITGYRLLTNSLSMILEIFFYGQIGVLGFVESLD